MADTWVSYTEFNSQYPGIIAESDFSVAAARAARSIEDATDWRAATADDDVTIEALAACQAVVIAEQVEWAKVDAKTCSGIITSASTDGYSESYASAADVRAERQRQVRADIRAALGAPDTRWMLYAGGVYHPPARR